MKDDLIKLRQKYPGYKVWCTGPSLGASMASMTALYLTKLNIVPAELVRLVTFGEPRTGNMAFARAVEENVQFRYRVVHRNDLLTNMPATINPVAFLLSSTVAERQPYFYRYLVFYDNDMKPGSLFSICTLSEDYACRNLALANNVLDHMNYFSIDTDLYLSKKCKGDLLKITANITRKTTTKTKATKTATTTTEEKTAKKATTKAATKASTKAATKASTKAATITITTTTTATTILNNTSDKAAMETIINNAVPTATATNNTVIE
uniref:Fungal lipase-like domain-containing protein n=1 Tax=Setaria digitata TaxID=48799 RepID=A0A915Q474_9BILA